MLNHRSVIPAKAGHPVDTAGALLCAGTYPISACAGTTSDWIEPKVRANPALFFSVMAGLSLARRKNPGVTEEQ
jgi:hypothetical protein